MSPHLHGARRAGQGRRLTAHLGGRAWDITAHMVGAPPSQEPVWAVMPPLAPAMKCPLTGPEKRNTLVMNAFMLLRDLGPATRLLPNAPEPQASGAMGRGADG